MNLVDIVNLDRQIDTINPSKLKGIPSRQIILCMSSLILMLAVKHDTNYKM